MKKTGASALFLISLLTACGGVEVVSSSRIPAFEAIDELGGMPPGYAQVWADEFDVKGLPNNRKWAYDTHANETGWYNNELQYYAEARALNSRVNDGFLIIDALKESAAGFSDSKRGSPQRYTSARLVTQGKASWTYGFVEVRAKIPCAQGAWPAIWMLADVPSLKWPLDGEIDIMEHVNNVDEIHFAVHTQAYNHVHQKHARSVTAATVCDHSFHNYQLTWTADKLLIGMDGRNYLRYNNQGTGRDQWPFNGPQYLLLNIAVGGDWPGPPDATTVFPLRMEVDYVRVYQVVSQK
jgi:beta-glucanase (GH16 family)